jgi:hypothetical protein
MEMSKNLPPSLTPLPQDPLLQVYFNQSLTSSYTEPYRLQTRPGDDLEKLIAEAIADAKSTVDVAVQEFRLPGIARVLADRQRSGIKVRLIVEHMYSRPWSDFSAQELAKLPERERDRYNEFVQLADTNKPLAGLLGILMLLGVAGFLGIYFLSNFPVTF